MELGDLEDTVRRFTTMLGWNEEIEQLMRTQETPVGYILIKKKKKVVLNTDTGE